MSILSIFTFKKKLKEIFSRENLSDLFDYAKNQILRLIENKDLLGKDKKIQVDKAVLLYFDMKFSTTNTIVKFITQLLKAVIPTITQFIYDYLKAYIEGLTKKTEQGL